LGNLLKKFKNDNSGAALVLVILVIAFVSMLVSVILVATVSNSNMKKNDQLGDGNFQVADSAIEELTMGLEEIADTAMREAYTYMLQVYSQTIQSKRFDLLRKAFSEKMVAKIKATNVVAGDPQYVDLDKLRAMISTASNGTMVLDSTDGTRPIYEVDSTDFSVVIKNVRLKYTDNNNYETTITTDIRFRVPSDLVDTSNVTDTIGFHEYGIITDGSIIRKTGEEGTFNVTSSIYAGTNIVVNGSKLNLTGQYIVSRGTLEVVDGGSVSLENTSTNLWVRNIATKTSGIYNSASHKNWITINCKSFVADDLTLNADFADVKISGYYYGYHTSNSTGVSSGTASGSSAVLINAKNAKLDFSGATQVTIAGKAYLSVPNYYSALSEAELAAYNLGVNNYQSFMMGESLSFKGVQSSYMVPGDCILGIKHNPMTKSEYESLTAGIAAGNPNLRVYLGQNVKDGGIDLLEYVDSSKPYIPQYAQYIGKDGVKTELVYLYLNFTGADKAADYFEKYYKQYGVRVQNLAEYLNLGEIIMNADIINTGNVLTNNSDGLSLTGRGENSQSNALIVKNELSFTRKYNGLITYLDQTYFTNDINTSAGDLLIHFKSNTSDSAGLMFQTATVLQEGYAGFTYSDAEIHHTTGQNADNHAFVLITPFDVELRKQGDKYYVYQTKNGAEQCGKLELDKAEGLVLSGGKITVTDVSFNGMLFAKDDVILNGTATITNNTFTGEYKYTYTEYAEDGSIMNAEARGDITNVEELIKHDQAIYKWFKTYSPAGSEDNDDALKNSVNIIFENWQKNN